MDRDLLKEMNALYGDRPDFQIVLRDLLKKEQKKDKTLWLTFKEGGKMYDQLNCHECQNYEFDDPSISNNCIHYRFCIKDPEKTNRRIEEEKENEMGNK